TLEVGVAHGIADDRRIIERRQIDRRLDIGGGDAAMRSAQRHAFGFRNRRAPLSDQPLHVAQRQQRAGKGEAVVGKLRHYFFSTGTACLSNKSAIASISLRSTTGTRAAGKALSEATATMCGSSGCISGLPLATRWISSLGKASRLKPSTSTRSTGDILPTSAARSHSGSSRNSCRIAQRLAEEMITSVAPAAR